MSKLIVKSGSPKRKASSQRQRVANTKKALRRVRKVKKASKANDGGAGRRAKICQSIALQDEKRRATQQALIEVDERLRRLKIALAKASEPIGYLLIINVMDASDAILPLAVDAPVFWHGLRFEVSRDALSFVCASTDGGREMSYVIPFSLTAETRLMIGPIGTHDTYTIMCFANEREAKRCLARIRSTGP